MTNDNKLSREEQIKAIYEKIHGFDGYLINRKGELKKKDTYRKNRHGTKSIHKGGICKITINKSNSNKNRAYVSITIDGKRKMMLVSRLMGYVFLGLDINDRKTLICHKDDNPLNNNLENLFLGTHKDNSQDMAIKERGATRKLVAWDVRDIRHLYSQGQSMLSISRKYKVSYYTINAICKRKSWIFI